MAKTIHKLGVSSVIDIGCNINAVLKNSSLITKLENFGIKYWGLDLYKRAFGFLKEILLKKLESG